MPEYRQEEHYESACNRTGGVGARIMDEPGQDAVNGISGQIQAAKIGKGIETIHTELKSPIIYRAIRMRVTAERSTGGPKWALLR